MSEFTVHLDNLNPARNPIVVPGRDPSRRWGARAWFITADDEVEAIARALAARQRSEADRWRAS